MVTGANWFLLMELDEIKDDSNTIVVVPDRSVSEEPTPPRVRQRSISLTLLPTSESMSLLADVRPWPTKSYFQF